MDSTSHNVISEATLSDVMSRSTRERKPLVSPVTRATSSMVSCCACRAARRRGPMATRRVSGSSGMGRMML